MILSVPYNPRINILSRISIRLKGWEGEVTRRTEKSNEGTEAFDTLIALKKALELVEQRIVAGVCEKK